MIYKKILIFLALGLILTSCDTNTRVYAERDYLNWKKKNENVSDLMSHFPNSIENEHISYGQSINRKYDYKSIRFKIRDLSHETLDTLQLFYQKNAIVHYGVDDSVLLACDFYPEGFIKNASLKPDRILLEKYIAKYTNTDLIPIPRFDTFFSTKHDTQTRYPKGYRIYVLDADSKQTLPDLELPNKGIMPTNWSRGYSRGIVLNIEKQTADYWLICW